MTHPLQQVFDQAIQQATKGKGERHGGDTTPFLEQPWVHYGKMHGRGFLTGQAAKKLEEAASTREGDAFVQEALGAIVYIAMAVLKEQERKEVVVPPAAIRRCSHIDSSGNRCRGSSGHGGRHSSKGR
jgi:hypothetical protein